MPRPTDRKPNPYADRWPDDVEDIRDQIIDILSDTAYTCSRPVMNRFLEGLQKRDFNRDIS